MINFINIKNKYSESQIFIIFGAFLAIGFLLQPQLRYHNYFSNIADLGFYFTNFYNITLNPQIAFQGHFQPLLFIWGFFYNNINENYAPHVVILFQSIALLYAVFLIWRYYGAITGMALLLYAPLWFNNLFDFHFDHLSVPILAIFFISIAQCKYKLAWISAASLAFIKEPFALETCACGLYILLIARKAEQEESARLKLIYMGSTLMVFGFALFIVETQWFLPYFAVNDINSFNSSAFNWMGKSLYEILLFIVKNPEYLIFNIYNQKGILLYFFLLFGLLGFIPIFSLLPLIVCSPLLLISALSLESNYYNISAHYTSGLIIPFIIAFNNGLPIAKLYFTKISNLFNNKNIFNFDRYFIILVFFILIIGNILFSISPISRLFFTNKIWGYGYETYTSLGRNGDISNALNSNIPNDRKIVISSQNSINSSFLSNRNIILPFPLGVNQKHVVPDWTGRNLYGFLNYIYLGNLKHLKVNYVSADYVIIDLRSPYFLIDKGCEWIYGACSDKFKQVLFMNEVSAALIHYDIIYEKNQFIIMRKKATLKHE